MLIQFIDSNLIREGKVKWGEAVKVEKALSLFSKKVKIKKFYYKREHEWGRGSSPFLSLRQDFPEMIVAFKEEEGREKAGQFFILFVEQRLLCNKMNYQNELKE